MRHLPLVLAAVVLTGCNPAAPGKATPSATPSAPAIVATTNATVEPVPTGPARAKVSASVDCGAAKAMKFIGQTATSSVRLEVAKAIGHLSIRWIGPGDVVTMDYSEARLNADLDDGGKIKHFHCG